CLTAYLYPTIIGRRRITSTMMVVEWLSSVAGRTVGAATKIRGCADTFRFQLVYLIWSRPKFLNNHGCSHILG
ncbi:MAG: hypothetical protein ACPLQP_11850, partial [Moorellaceae bacterium]